MYVMNSKSSFASFKTGQEFPVVIIGPAGFKAGKLTLKRGSQL